MNDFIELNKRIVTYYLPKYGIVGSKGDQIVNAHMGEKSSLPVEKYGQMGRQNLDFAFSC